MPRYKGGGTARSGYDITSSDLPYYAINARLANAKQYSTKLMRSEYTRMRDIAQKRLQRLAASDEGKYVAAMHPDGFPKLSQLGKSIDPFTGKKDVDRKELAKALKTLVNFLNSRQSAVSTVKETHKRTRESIKKSTGIDVPKEQMANYGRFINRLKKELGLETYKYEAKYIVEAWSDLQNKGKITKKELTDAVLGVMADLKRLDDPKEDKKKAERIAYKIDNYFDTADLDKRTVSGLKRRKKRT